jgi:nucleotide-binding universal stress UspA family protein
MNYAIDMAAREKGTIHFLHVIDGDSCVAAYPDGLLIELPGVRDQLIEVATARLDERVERCRAAGVRASRCVAFGRAAPLIAQEASSRDADLIVMGTHGRSGFSHFLLGSVAERVLRLAQCPVLTVRETSRVADAIALDAAARRRRIAQPA